MKTPRIDAFVPNKKSAPELKSSLDNMPVIEKPKQQQKEAVNSSPVLPVHPVRVVRDVPSSVNTPQKRVMKSRWPVDIHQDQYEALQRLALEERMQGGIGSMSAMVREALDKLIAEKTRRK